jgi:hypothetical protein
MKTARSIGMCVAVAVAICALSALDAPACSVCYGDPESPITKGMNAGIWFLLGITGCVLAAFGGFIVYLARRARLFTREIAVTN